MTRVSDERLAAMIKYAELCAGSPGDDSGDLDALLDLRDERAKAASAISALARLVTYDGERWEIGIIEGVSIADELAGVDLDALKKEYERQRSQ